MRGNYKGFYPLISQKSKIFDSFSHRESQGAETDPYVIPRAVRPVGISRGKVAAFL